MLPKHDLFVDFSSYETAKIREFTVLDLKFETSKNKQNDQFNFVFQRKVSFYDKNNMRELLRDSL